MIALALYKCAYYPAFMSDSFGFLISDVSRLIRRRFDERARSIGSTRAQWRTLVVLSRNEGINQGGLADLLEVEPISLCRMIDRLEESGLVERRRDPQDRRAWQIYLTDRAGPVLEKLRVIADELFENALDGVPASTREILMSSLGSIRERLLVEPLPQEAANG